MAAESSSFDPRRAWSAAGVWRRQAAFGTWLIIACSRPAALDTPAAGARATLEVAVEQVLPLAVETLPVPPADGPKLAPTKLASPVYARPDKGAAKIGYLRLGARVARSAEHVWRRGCDGGWYAIRPLGFVCAGEDATARLDHPATRGFELEPDRARPLPYVYAVARGPVPAYLRLPTPEEQRSEEPPPAPDAATPADARRAGANDVPLGPEGVAMGPAPDPGASPEPLHSFGGVGAEGGELLAWLGGGRQLPSPPSAPDAAAPGVAFHVPAGTRLALIGAISGAGAAGPRQLALTADGHLAPPELLQVEPGSTFHGQDLREVGLPVAFARRAGARLWALRGNRLEPGRALARRELVPLTGAERVMGGEHMLESRDGPWLRRRELHVAARPSELPPIAARAGRWIDVSIESQLLVLWERDVPVYATLVSTAGDELGAAAELRSTPRGTFRIQQKHVTARLPFGGEEGAAGMWDVPWVMSFEGGGTLHGAYWHDDFGRPRSRGGIELSPIDARFVFLWSLPDVPEHWHGAYATASTGPGTPVRIRP